MAAMIVIIGTIDRSWNSRIEKARSPCGVLSSFSARSIGSTCAVDERPSGSPIAKRRLGRNAEREIEKRAEREAAQRHLEQPETEDILAQPPQPARLKLETDDEQQQRDADLGDVLDQLRLLEQAEHGRADQRAGHDVAEGGAEPEPAERGHENQRDAEHHCAVAQERAG